MSGVEFRARSIFSVLASAGLRFRRCVLVLVGLDRPSLEVRKKATWVEKCGWSPAVPWQLRWDIFSRGLTKDLRPEGNCSTETVARPKENFGRMSSGQLAEIASSDRCLENSFQKYILRFSPPGFCRHAHASFSAVVLRTAPPKCHVSDNLLGKVHICTFDPPLNSEVRVSTV